MATKTLLALLMAALIASASAASVGTKRPRVPARGKTTQPTTTTTPKPLTPFDKIAIADKNVAKVELLAEDFANQLRSRMDWEHLLSPAPLSIGILGDLMIISGQTRDFPIDAQMPDGGFQYIKYPKSFQTTLIQIGNEGHRAFMTAHDNMDKIRLLSASVPGYMKEATKILLSGDAQIVETYLPLPMNRIKEAADQGVQLSLQVVEKFDDSMNLIMEVVEAAKSTQSVVDEEIADITREKSILNVTMVLTKNLLDELNRTKINEMESLSKAQDELRKRLDEFPSGWQMIGMDFVEGLGNQVNTMLQSAVPLAMAYASPTAGALAMGSQTFNNFPQRGSQEQTQVSQDPVPYDTATSCLLQHAKQVLRLEGVANYLKNSFSNFDSINTASGGIYDQSKDVQQFQRIQRQVISCFPIETAISKGVEFVNALADLARCNSTAADVTDEQSGDMAEDRSKRSPIKIFSRKSARKGSPVKSAPKVEEPEPVEASSAPPVNSGCDREPVSTLMNIFFEASSNLKNFVSSNRQPIPNRTPMIQTSAGGSASSKLIASAKFKAQVAQSVLEQTRESLEKTKAAMLAKNEEYIKILVDMQRLQVNELRYDEAIKLLKEGLVKLSELKEHWAKLVRFFKTISNIIQYVGSTSLKDFTDVIDRTAENIQEGFKKIVIDMIYTQVAKANQATSLVHNMASLYVDISDRYIMDNIARLDRLMSLDAKKVDIAMERDKLMQLCKQDSEKIVELILAEKQKIIDRVQARADQVREEYAFLDEVPTGDANEDELVDQYAK